MKQLITLGFSSSYTNELIFFFFKKKKEMKACLISYENLKTGEQYPTYKFSLVIPIYIDNEEEILYLSTTQKIKLD